MKKTRFFTVLTALVLACCLFVPRASAQSLSSSPTLHQHTASVAATHCWEASCNGTDPYKVGCAGGSASWKVLLSAYVRNSSNTIIGYVQLWYSTTCDTNWTRVVSYNPTFIMAWLGDNAVSKTASVENTWAGSNAPNPSPYPGTDIHTFQHWIPDAAYCFLCSRSNSHPPCYGSGCYGLDPFATKCGIVTSYNSHPHLAKPIPTMMSNGIAYGPTIGTIINYYSTWCNANWAEATMTNTTGISINISVTQPSFQQKYEPASGFFSGLYCCDHLVRRKNSKEGVRDECAQEKVISELIPHTFRTLFLLSFHQTKRSRSFISVKGE